MPRKRSSKTADEQDERLKSEALRAMDSADAAEDAIDAMVKRSIKLHGP